MSSGFKVIVFVWTLLFPLFAAAAGGGKVILELEENSERRQIDYPALYKEYLQELDIFDKKYPGARIEEDFSDDILALHPDYSDREAAVKTNLLRLGISGRRTYRFWEEQVKEFLFENEIPLQFADDQYEMGEPEVYQPSDRPIVIKDFKKAIAYSDSPQDRLAVQDKLARDSGRMTHAERSRILKKALLERDWKTLISYGLFDGTALEDERGLGRWHKTPEMQARLLSAVKNIVSGKTVEVKGVLQLYTEPGWFLLNRGYRQHPGLQVDFSASSNLAGIELNWPLPRRYFINLEQSFSGYPGLTSIPFMAQVADPSKPLKLVAEISAGLCAGEKCRTIRLQPQLELESGKEQQLSGAAVMIRQIESQSPHNNGSGLELERLVVEKGTPAVLRLEAEADETPAAFEVFIEGAAADEFMPPLVRIDGHRIITRFIPRNNGQNLAGREFSLVAGTSPGRAVRRIMVAEGESFADAENGSLNIALLFMAFFGGLLLNIMPCLLPVLLLKIMTFTHFGAIDVETVRRRFVFNLWGIAAASVFVIGSFALFGNSWGMQFQSPVFLTLTMFLVSALAAHLWGWFGTAAEKTNEPNTRKKDAFQFAAGILIVILAAACPAPYLASALAVAQTGSALQTAVILIIAGLGLAAPYILFAAVPAAAYYIPRPGRWLRRVNIIIFILLAAALLWLLVLLAALGGVALSGRFVLLTGAFWLLLLFRKQALNSLDEQEDDPEIIAKVRALFNLIAILLSAGLIWWGYRTAASDTALHYRAPTERIEEQEIRSALQNRRSILVKVGADWCLRCKYNDFVAFDTPQVLQALERYNVTIREMNWDGRNNDIFGFMHKFGRSNVPFYVIFTPRIPGGMVLPQILSERKLLNVIEQSERY